MLLKTRSLFYVMIVVLASMLYGCQGAKQAIFAKLTLSEGSVVFGVDGETRSIEVTAYPESESWQADYAGVPEDWFTFKATPNSLEVTAQPNYSIETRSGVIVLSSPEGNFEPFELKVVQEAAAELEFATSATDYAFDSEGGSYTFTVRSNYSWDVSSDSDWLSVEKDEANGLVTVSAQPNATDKGLSAILTVTAGLGEMEKVVQFVVTQGTKEDNTYLKLLGQWEITAAKWYYSPNGSLNTLDYAPSPTQYYLIFDLEQGEYGKSYIMRNFLYPGTSLEVRYDKEEGKIVIPFGWTVYSYDYFLYVTLVGTSSFSYASFEVDGVISADRSSISLDLPAVDGFNYVGFGLWTYNDNGNKVAVGSRSYPTMFPMGPIVFKKQSL